MEASSLESAQPERQWAFAIGEAVLVTPTVGPPLLGTICDRSWFLFQAGIYAVDVGDGPLKAVWARPGEIVTQEGVQNAA